MGRLVLLAVGLGFVPAVAVLDAWLAHAAEPT
jgi:hypothetical protein